jgi:hypothetical protein
MYQFLENTAKRFPDNLILTREKIKYPEFVEMVKGNAKDA